MKHTRKNDKKLKFVLYTIFFCIFLVTAYLWTPKLFNFSSESIKKNLKSNYNINIKNISNVNYKILPTPRLVILNSNFSIGEKVLEVNNSDLEIVLNITQILNSKKINFKRLLINNGFSKINLSNIDILLTIIKKNKKEFIFKKNNLVFLQENKFFFEINDALIKTHHIEDKKELNINGNFLNNKISMKLSNTLKDKNNLIIRIPKLDIATRVFFEKNNLGNINGVFNLEVLNNFLKFNFVKENDIKLIDGFIRSRFFNSSIKGEVKLKPNFFSTLDFKVSNLNFKKLYPLIKKTYFSENINNLPLITKLNGIYNLESKFKGRITNKNGEVLFEDVKLGKNKTIYFNARIIEFGKNGKVQFNLVKKVQRKKNLSQKIEIKGFLIPSSSRIVFENFLINGSELSVKKVKEYENKFVDELIQDSLVDIFNESKINKYFKNLF